jgi:hypothetical protein
MKKLLVIAGRGMSLAIVTGSDSGMPFMASVFWPAD